MSTQVRLYKGRSATFAASGSMSTLTLVSSGEDVTHNLANTADGKLVLGSEFWGYMGNDTLAFLDTGDDYYEIAVLPNSMRI